MKLALISFVLSGLLVAVAHGQPKPTKEFRLWPQAAPGALGNAPQDIPTLTPFFPSPDKATGAAMVICPGGSYVQLAEYEGKEYALWLNDHGIACFVLKYRLGSHGYRYPVMLEDAARALRTVRAHAAEWKIDPHRIGIMGSSAGGHLAGMLLTHFDAGNPKAKDPIDRVSSRPDLGVLCYAVITMGKFTHGGSRRNLLGRHPSAVLIRETSDELHVTANTSPCFIWCSDADRAVSPENSLMFAEALRKAGVPFSLHIYEWGHHGMGMGVRKYNRNDLSKMAPWTRDCIYWLKQHHFAD